MRCGKKSQHLLIVHRRSVRHSRMHSTRFSQTTAVFRISVSGSIRKSRGALGTNQFRRLI
jgi:hypothetical protein